MDCPQILWWVHTRHTKNFDTNLTHKICNLGFFRNLMRVKFFCKKKKWTTFQISTGWPKIFATKKKWNFSNFPMVWEIFFAKKKSGTFQISPGCGFSIHSCRRHEWMKHIIHSCRHRSTHVVDMSGSCHCCVFLSC